MGKGLKAQAISPSRLLLKVCPFIHRPPSSWQLGDFRLPIKKVQNDVRNIRGGWAGRQTGVSRWYCSCCPSRAGSCGAVGIRQLAAPLDAIVPSWRTLQTAVDLEEDRRQGEPVIYEVEGVEGGGWVRGRRACFSSKSQPLG